ncbi:hypothetical protein ACO0K9_13825 [Undibacterium sp. Ji50W]|uniref:hypothetical protein n=1 Tax=Undibacterium sp. Ji50W TaxID=3413041 RepID=UPI003BF323CB
MTFPKDASLATLVMRLRAATEMQVLVCKTVLEPLSDQHRQWYVEKFEGDSSWSGSSLLFDPIEVDPKYSELIEAIRHEAKNKLNAGELGDGRRGRSGRMWSWMKNELYARHKIIWRTPLEMSPPIALY